MESIKREITDLTKRKDLLEKEIVTANAKRDAHLDLLRKEFGIGKYEEIDELIKKYKIDAEDLKALIDESLEKIKLHVKNLEVIVNGK